MEEAAYTHSIETKINFSRMLRVQVVNAIIVVLFIGTTARAATPRTGLDMMYPSPSRSRT